jgi:hypothetical protein
LEEEEEKEGTERNTEAQKDNQISQQGPGGPRGREERRKGQVRKTTAALESTGSPNTGLSHM